MAAFYNTRGALHNVWELSIMYGSWAKTGVGGVGHPQSHGITNGAVIGKTLVAMRHFFGTFRCKSSRFILAQTSNSVPQCSHTTSRHSSVWGFQMCSLRRAFGKMIRKFGTSTTISYGLAIMGHLLSTAALHVKGTFMPVICIMVVSSRKLTAY